MKSKYDYDMPLKRIPSKLKPEQRRNRRILTAITVMYTFVIAFITINNLFGPENWWFGSLNLFLPQWPLILPSVILLPFFLRLVWKWTWVPLVLGVWATFGLAGLNIRFATPQPPRDSTRVRVMSYNVKWGNRSAGGVIRNVQNVAPDVLVLQDATYALDTKLKALKEKQNVAIHHQYAILSRFPILSKEVRKMGGNDCLRCVLDVEGQKVVVYSVHFATPRWAIKAVSSEGTDATDDLVRNSRRRVLEATDIAKYFKDEPLPTIIAGDLNSPHTAQAFNILTNTGLRDAFASKGMGFGYTYGKTTPVRHSYVRIDHILFSKEWVPVDCWVGSEQGSDHLPVIADLFLPTRSQGNPTSTQTSSR